MYGKVLVEDGVVVVVRCAVELKSMMVGEGGAPHRS